MIRRFLIAACITAAGLGSALASETIALMLDRATVIKAPAKTAMVVIGNPAIADVAVQRNGVLVLTGKAFGETNLLALDDEGKLISESWLRVQDNNRNLVILRGAETESYSCTPECKPALALGDSDKHFARSGSQSVTRNGLANQNQGQPR
jgi:ABC-type enterochelin transport system substrate-binding protein